MKRFFLFMLILVCAGTFISCDKDHEPMLPEEVVEQEDLTKAIDIQRERLNADHRELMQKPLAERVAKGYTIQNVDIKVEFSSDVSGFVEKVYAKVQDNYSK
ncbi:MAG: hypothetical protein II502_05000, partial [Paludibacteraceae bacterium]|nr:hypothetical protein [Paludibacteraceae bacterium]